LLAVVRSTSMEVITSNASMLVTSLARDIVKYVFFRRSTLYLPSEIIIRSVAEFF